MFADDICPLVDIEGFLAFNDRDTQTAANVQGINSWTALSQTLDGADGITVNPDMGVALQTIEILV